MQESLGSTISPPTGVHHSSGKTQYHQRTNPTQIMLLNMRLISSMRGCNDSSSIRIIYLTPLEIGMVIILLFYVKFLSVKRKRKIFKCKLNTIILFFTTQSNLDSDLDLDSKSLYYQGEKNEKNRDQSSLRQPCIRNRHCPAKQPLQETRNDSCDYYL